MDGIKNQYQLPPPLDGVAFDESNLPPKLPCDMESALDALVNDQIIRSAFGEEFIKCFVALKTHEAKLQKEAAEKGIDETEWARSYYFDYL
ncbi:Lengsin [Holothuria leucospilota]|uniref:Lengsin n=1 Tax=Holothuria leucospilota TaxID=206669 RepID=A0A9Q1BLB1_HOLLE|nr:Lengsin [Holothuria leucospilota]